VLGIQDLDVVVGLDVRGGDDARALLLQRQRGVVHGVHANGDVLEVQQDFKHVFLEALDGGVLVQHAIDLDFRDGEAGDRGQQHAPQGVAQRVAIAALERLDDHLGAVGAEAFNVGAARTQHRSSGNRHGQGVS